MCKDILFTMRKRLKKSFKLVNIVTEYGFTNYSEPNRMKASGILKSRNFLCFLGSRLFRKARKSENHILERNEYNEVPDY